MDELPWWRQLWGVPSWMERNARWQVRPLSRRRIVYLRAHYLLVLPVAVFVVVVPLNLPLWPMAPGLVLQILALASLTAEQRQQILGRA